MLSSKAKRKVGPKSCVEMKRNKVKHSKRQSRNNELKTQHSSTKSVPNDAVTQRYFLRPRRKRPNYNLRQLTDNCKFKNETDFESDSVDFKTIRLHRKPAFAQRKAQKTMINLTESSDDGSSRTETEHIKIRLFGIKFGDFSDLWHPKLRRPQPFVIVWKSGTLELNFKCNNNNSLISVPLSHNEVTRLCVSDNSNLFQLGSRTDSNDYLFHWSTIISSHAFNHYHWLHKYYKSADPITLIFGADDYRRFRAVITAHDWAHNFNQRIRSDDDGIDVTTAKIKRTRARTVWFAMEKIHSAETTTQSNNESQSNDSTIQWTNNNALELTDFEMTTPPLLDDADNYCPSNDVRSDDNSDGDADADDTDIDIDDCCANHSCDANESGSDEDESKTQLLNQSNSDDYKPYIETRQTANRESDPLYRFEVEMYRKLVFILTPKDISKLTNFDYLNDSLIDWFSIYLYCQWQPSLQSRVHVYNSFFYKSVIRPPQTNNKPRIPSVPSKKYILRQRQLWNKDYLIVPIMLRNHWFLIIVCYPRLINCVKGNTNQQCCIVCLDSMALGRRSTVCNDIRKYLQTLCKVIYPNADKQSIIFNDKTCPTIHPKLPRQPNGYDCGIYLLKYLQSFGVNNGNFANCDIWFNESDARQMRKHMLDVIKGGPHLS